MFYPGEVFTLSCFLLPLHFCLCPLRLSPFMITSVATVNVRSLFIQWPIQFVFSSWLLLIFAAPTLLYPTHLHSVLCPPILSFPFFSMFTSRKFPTLTHSLFSVSTTQLHYGAALHTKHFAIIFHRVIFERLYYTLLFQLNPSLTTVVCVSTSRLHRMSFDI